MSFRQRYEAGFVDCRDGKRQSRLGCRVRIDTCADLHAGMVQQLDEQSRLLVVRNDLCCFESRRGVAAEQMSNGAAASPKLHAPTGFSRPGYRSAGDEQRVCRTGSLEPMSGLKSQQIR